jgi:hypothetical protein
LAIAILSIKIYAIIQKITIKVTLFFKSLSDIMPLLVF